MPYDTAILKQKAIEAIRKSNLIFVEDVCAYIGISKSTFYDHFKEGSDDSNELKELLEKNKVKLKVDIRKMWYERRSDTGLMALYKLCSTPEEHKKLSQNYTDITSKDEAIMQAQPMTAEQAKEMLTKLDKQY